jgi:hypothetical protein
MSATASSFRAAIERWDIDALRELFAPEIVFHSPVTDDPFRGRDTVAKVLALVAETFEEFRYTDELEGKGTHALLFRASVASNELQGVDFIRLDEQGLIAEFTVLLRPITGLIPFAEAMGPKIGAAGLMPPPS